MLELILLIAFVVFCFWVVKKLFNALEYGMIKAYDKVSKPKKNPLSPTDGDTKNQRI